MRVFDPTIFENMKVVLEGAIYDQDLIGEITVVDRQDQVDLARLQRSYRVTYRLNETVAEGASPTATFCLVTDGPDWAGEVLESKSLSEIGCTINIELSLGRIHPDHISQLHKARESLEELWGGRPAIELVVIGALAKAIPNEAAAPVVPHFTVEAELDFGRKINEDQMDDVLRLLQKTTDTLRFWSERLDSRGFFA